MTADLARRYERAGFALWGAAQEIRDVRDGWPPGDGLVVRLRAVEELASSVAAEIADVLREMEARPT